MSFTDYDFPNTRMYESDLREVLANMRKLEQIVQTFVTTEKVVFADPIQWSIASQYTQNTVVLDMYGNAYISKQPVPTGIQLSNDDYWLEIFNFMDYVKSFDSNLTWNIEDHTERASVAYETGDWLLLDDLLYKVIADIAIDEKFIVGTNIERFTVEDFCRAWTVYTQNLINQYKDDIDASELQYRNQLAQDIANTTASLQAQLDAVIAGATVDSEVIDARVGYNATTYSTLGNAIRSQMDIIQDIHDSSQFASFSNPVSVTSVELGSCDVSGGAIVYSSNNKRIRIKQTDTVTLKAGTIIGVIDENTYSFNLVDVVNNVRYGFHQIICVPRDSTYNIVVAKQGEDVTYSDVYTLYNQLYIKTPSKNNNVYHDFDFIRGQWSSKGYVTYEGTTSISARNIIHIKKGSTIVFTGTSGLGSIQVLKFNADGTYIGYTAYTNIFYADADMYIAFNVKWTVSGVYQTITYKNLYELFSFNLICYDDITIDNVIAFAGFSEYDNGSCMQHRLDVRNISSSQASVIVTKNRKCIGIDFSRNDTTPSAFITYMNQFYKYNMVAKLDVIILSHYHSDHYGTLQALVENGYIDITDAIAFLPDELTAENSAILADSATLISHQTDFLAVLNNNNCTIIHPDENQTYDIDGLQFRFYNTDYSIYNDSNSEYYSTNYNDWSVGVQITSGDIVIDMPADLGSKGQAYMAKKLLPCTILSAPHHGWDNGVNNLIPDFINGLNPDIVVSQNGSEMKPGGIADVDTASSPMQSWCEANGKPNYCTFENGTIQVTFNDKAYKLDGPYVKHIRNKKNWSYSDNSEHIEN